MLQTSKPMQRSHANNVDCLNPEATLIALRKQLEKAKEKKDKILSHKIRQKIWLLQDATAGVKSPVSEKDLAEILDENTPPSGASNGNGCDAASEVDEAKGKLVMKESQEAFLNKKLRKLRKKIADIKNLKQKQSDGVKLEKTQEEKIGREGEILEEIDDVEEQLFVLSKM